MAKAPETPASEPAFDLRKLMGEFDPNKLMVYRPRFFAHKAALLRPPVHPGLWTNSAPPTLRIPTTGKRPAEG
jgi:hypothetical protein